MANIINIYKNKGIALHCKNYCGISLLSKAGQIQEKSREKNKLHVAFIGMAKAFDSVSRKALWQIMRRCGIPDKFITIVENLHKNNTARVPINVELSEPFQMRTGLRQGYILVPLLFNLFLAALSIIIDRNLNARGLGV